MLLSIDTSTAQSGLALYDGAQVLAELLWHSRAHHTRELAPALAGLLERTGAKMDEVKAVGCGGRSRVFHQPAGGVVVRQRARAGAQAAHRGHPHPGYRGRRPAHRQGQAGGCPAGRARPAGDGALRMVEERMAAEGRARGHPRGRSGGVHPSSRCWCAGN